LAKADLMYRASQVGTALRVIAAAILVAVGLLHGYSAAVHWSSGVGPPGARAELDMRTAARRTGYAAVLILVGAWVLKSVLKRVQRQARHCAGRPGFEAVQNLVAHAGLTIEEAEYQQLAFGSWSIRVSSRPATRLVWQGKEACAMLEIETESSHLGRPTWTTIWSSRQRAEQKAGNVVRVLVEQLRRDQPV
jgi:hypothetical protein